MLSQHTVAHLRFSMLLIMKIVSKTIILFSQALLIGNSTHDFLKNLKAKHLFIVSPDQKCVYELSAVLIHRGISAYSGHYIAHVKDARTSDWYKFNDEEIEKMEGKKLQLGLEDDIGECH